MAKSRKIIYFSPSTDSEVELESIQRVVDHHAAVGIAITITAGWPNLMRQLEEPEDALVVFRLDCLERNDMMIDEVLSMLSSLSRFVAERQRVDIAVVVPELLDADLLAKLKRNDVLGVIPGMRFFDAEHSVTAYQTLARGESHWPSIVVKPELQRAVVRKREIGLTDRQAEVFKLITQRGLPNRKIAEILQVSEDTVKGHVSAIIRRYGVQNRTQLILASKTGALKPTH
jgi:DNA-binding NarL/FixJ family response regulator